VRLINAWIICKTEERSHYLIRNSSVMDQVRAGIDQSRCTSFSICFRPFLYFFLEKSPDLAPSVKHFAVCERPPELDSRPQALVLSSDNPNSSSGA
jgi:hypothetical protein